MMPRWGGRAGECLRHQGSNPTGLPPVARRCPFPLPVPVPVWKPARAGRDGSGRNPTVCPSGRERPQINSGVLAGRAAAGKNVRAGHRPFFPACGLQDQAGLFSSTATPRGGRPGAAPLTSKGRRLGEGLKRSRGEGTGRGVGGPGGRGAAHARPEGARYGRAGDCRDRATAGRRAGGACTPCECRVGGCFP